MVVSLHCLKPKGNPKPGPAHPLLPRPPRRGPAPPGSQLHPQTLPSAQRPAPGPRPLRPSRTPARHFRGGGGSEVHFRQRGSGGGGGAGDRAGAPGDRRTHGRAAGSHGARPRGRGARAAAVSVLKGLAWLRGAVSVLLAAVWRAGPGREAGAVRPDAPETPHSRGGRGRSRRTPGSGPGTASQTPAEPRPPSIQPSDLGCVPTFPGILVEFEREVLVTGAAIQEGELITGGHRGSLGRVHPDTV